ncbi:hypothetical protein [Streptomyces venezuelae]|uniref:hypothetical protein n=1 Tax=Streptomyces venezuelae TaxID=54571 RepID=UPI00123B877B|nr:hypothetical protein [Streptomyces venezuelae]
MYDENGSLRAVFGRQPDGTSGITALNGPRPPAPSSPQVEPVLGGVHGAISARRSVSIRYQGAG